MKLLDKYNRINISVTVIIMLVTGVIYYFTIHAILTHQVDKALLVEEREVFDYVQLNHHLPQVFRTNHQEIIFTVANGPVKRKFVDTSYRDTKDLDMEPARAIITSVMVGSQLYKITVIQSTVETEDLIGDVFLITIVLIFILVIALFLSNRLILRRIWQPFYTILHQLKIFNLAEDRAISSVPSTIDEFTELDQAVGIMATKAKHDYLNLKAFTENAAHELMTPISVINSKLDTLVQTGQFSDSQSQLLNDIYNTVARLTRLNKSMLLLTKIENGLIHDQQNINLKELLSTSFWQYEELLGSLNIKLTTQLSDCEVEASPLLMEVLINNLISNAIRHNLPGGSITVSLNQQQLKISNTGKDGEIDIERVFKRFQKSSASEGIGLGLTICRQICNNYGFDLQYHFSQNTHHFSISFTVPE